MLREWRLQLQQAAEAGVQKLGLWLFNSNGSFERVSSSRDGVDLVPLNPERFKRTVSYLIGIILVRRSDHQIIRRITDPVSSGPGSISVFITI